MHVPMLLRVRMGRHCLPRGAVLGVAPARFCVECGEEHEKKVRSPRSPVLATLETGGFLKGNVLAALLQVGRRLAGN